MLGQETRVQKTVKAWAKKQSYLTWQATPSYFPISKSEIIPILQESSSIDQ